VDFVQVVVSQVSEVIRNGGSLAVLAFMFFGGICAHFILAMVLRYMHRVAIDSVQRWDDVVISALGSPLRVMVWIFVVSIGMGQVPELVGLRQQLAPAYDTALVIVLTWFVLRLIRAVENEMLDESRGRTGSVDKASIHATAKLLRVIIWILAGLMVLQSVGVSISGLLAFGGIGGIAVGFAAKDMLANFFGGLSIYLDRPFTTGDWIRSPDQEIEGTVEDIGWRLTRIRTFDQRPLYVPNAVFSQVSVENPSRMRNRRIYETIGVRYEDAAVLSNIVAQVREMLEHHEEIDLSRTLIVNFVSFGPSTLDFFVYTFTKTTNWVKFHAIKQDVLLKILEIVHANGADVAFPTTTVHLQQLPQEPEV